MLTPTRALLMNRIDVKIKRGYYVDGPDGEPNPHETYCRRHADEAAKKHAGAYVGACWAGSDLVERCAVCEVELDTGGLTDYGVDSALGLTEEDPKAVFCTPGELEFSACALPNGDPRWALWDFHMLRALDEGRHP